MSVTAGFDARVERAGLEFLAAFYAAETRRHPGNLEALSELGHVLTKLGRFEEGLAVDRRLVELAPESDTARYNLACSLALCGRREEALDELEHAVRLGYDDLPHLLADEDLRGLREEPRFRALVERLR